MVFLSQSLIDFFHSFWVISVLRSIAGPANTSVSYFILLCCLLDISWHVHSVNPLILFHPLFIVMYLLRLPTAFFFFPSKKDCNPFSTGFSSFVSAGLKLSAHSAGTTTSACPELPKSTSWDSRGTVVIWACGMHRRRKSDTHLAKHGLLVCLARTSQAWMGTISVQRCWTHCQ